MRVSTLLNLGTLSEFLDERIDESTLKIFDGWLFEYRSVDTRIGNCVTAASSAWLYLGERRGGKKRACTRRIAILMGIYTTLPGVPLTHKY